MRASLSLPHQRMRLIEGAGIFNDPDEDGIRCATSVELPAPPQ
jgi:hypothetical protein